MEANCTNLTERILRLTLEIIYLLTGEDNIVVKKTSGDGQNSIMVPLHLLLVPERNNEKKKILEVTKKIIELLTGEGGNWSNFNICIKKEIKEEKEEESVMKKNKHLEGHNDLYKDVMMENQPPLTSPDGSSNGNPPERCPRPLYSRDSTQEGHTIPHHHQVDGYSNGNPPERCLHPLYLRDCTQDDHTIPHQYQADGSSNGNPPERCPCPMYSWDSTQENHTIPHHHQVDGSSNSNPPERCPLPLYSQDSTQEDHTIPHHHQGTEAFNITNEVKEEEMYMSRNQLSMKETEMMVTLTKEESSLDVSTGGPNGWKTSEGHLILSAHYNKDDNGMAEHSPGVSIVTQNIHHKPNHMVRPTGWFNSEESKDKPHTVIPNVQPNLYIAEKSPDPSNHKEYSPHNLHPQSFSKQDLVVPPSICTSERRFSCPECEISFTKKSHFVQHQRTHTGEKPYTCSECGKSYTEKSSLKRHHRVHTGEKPFCCSECGKRFSDKRNCDRHMRVHADEKLFSCSEEISPPKNTEHLSPLKNVWWSVIG